jgi:serine phosphatase RsbU (regulator of sigma subunit)
MPFIVEERQRNMHYLSLRNKILVVVIAVVIIFAPFLFLYFPNQQEDLLVNSYNQEVKNIARTVALGVNIALTEQNFEGVQSAMEHAKADERLEFVALVQVDSVETEDSGNMELTKTAFVSFPEDLDLDLFIESSDTIVVSRAEIRSEMLNGEVLVGFSTQEIRANISAIRTTSIIGSFIVSFIGIFIGFLLARSISKPILKLRDATKKVGEGDLSQRVHIGSKDEIGQLSDSFNIMVSQLFETESKLIESKNIIETKNLNITDSINYAKRIQSSMLPSEELIQRIFPDSFLMYRPKDVVSGDFPWMVELQEEVLIAAVDCTGHGVPGAMMAIIGNFILEDIVRSNNITQPDLILDHLHKGVNRTLKQLSEEAISDEDQITLGEVNDGMDVAMCKVNATTKQIQFAGAFRPLYHLRNGDIQEVKGNRFPVGGTQYSNLGVKIKFTNHDLEILPGDTVYFFSDGFQDQIGGPKGTKFSTRKMKELIKENSALSMADQKEIFDSAFLEWKGNEEQMDDILVIGIKF